MSLIVFVRSELVRLNINREVLKSRRIAGNRDRRTLQRQTTVKVLLFLLLLLYPGLATRLFQTFRCQKVDGVGLVLEQDFALSCFAGAHAVHLGAVACGIAVYIVGIPAGILGALWKNRRHLHDAPA